MKQLHDLKVWPEFFHAIRQGEKRCEWRKEDDRHFEAWDHLVLREWDPRLPFVADPPPAHYANTGDYTGAVLCAVVTHVLRAGEEGSPFGIPVGYALLSIRLLHDHMDDQKGLYFGAYLEKNILHREEALRREEKF